jgi:solute carrier family 36 (proton-coupled amino acid transporter)
MLVNIFICIGQIGIGIAYLIFTGTQIDQVICFESSGEACKMKNYYILFSVGILIPILWIKTIKKLTVINFFSLFMIFASLGVVMFYNVKFIESNEYSTRTVQLFNFWEYPLFFGIAVLNFEGNPMCLNIQASLRYPKHFTKVLIISTGFVAFTVVLSATLSYIAYGNFIEDLVSLNLPHN